MAEIHVLSSDTINRIAAGEVVERPSGVVKELVENSIDAGSSAITVEIRGGGIDLIRVTDNGCGIAASEVRTAFLRHATSKISDAQDLTSLHSLGFRGEALSSIAAVAEVEMITKPKEALCAVRALGSPGKKGAGDKVASDQPSLELSEVGAPDGTSVMVRDLFGNVPVRRKFLKSPQAEAGAITDLVSSFALSHPEISFHYRKDGQEKLHTTGNGDVRELIYRIYGRETARAVVECSASEESGDMALHGFLGRPELSRSTRGSELFFVNGRILSSDVLSRGLEEGYRTDLMQHRFPFAMIWLEVPPQSIDVNVHPAKREVRFTDARRVYDFLNTSVHEALRGQELIPRASLNSRAEEAAAEKEETRARETAQSLQPHREPFERDAGEKTEEKTVNAVWSGMTAKDKPIRSTHAEEPGPDLLQEELSHYGRPVEDAGHAAPDEKEFVFIDKTTSCSQQSLFSPPRPLPDVKTAGQGSSPDESVSCDAPGAGPSDALSVSAGSSTASEGPLACSDRESLSSYSEEEPVFTSENARCFRYVGQVFGTYWIIEYQSKMLMIDQHAAHEKVNFERLMRRLKEEQSGPVSSQLLSPPLVINLTGTEEAVYGQYDTYFRRMGYDLDPFGEHAFAIRSIPLELYGNDPCELLRQTLDEIADRKLSGTPSAILYKIASMSCKAAIKGNTRMTQKEAEDLIEEMLQCENPYHCPHGRPTMIVLSQGEIDRKFKRVL